MTSHNAEMSTVPAKKKRGRPATGRTPDKDRKAKSREALREAGGRPVSLDLLPEQAAQLDAVKGHHGDASDGAAVVALIAREYKRIQRRAK